MIIEMKKNLLYAALLGCLMLGSQACNDDYVDATGEHFYGPTENPPLKMNPAATVTAAYDMFAGDTEATAFSITPYEKVIKEQLGMTIDELISAIGNGTVKVCPINPNRNVWDKTPANGGNPYAWYVNNSGNVCEADAKNKYATIEFDPATKEFKFVLNENAGGTVPLSIGFALDGPNYNTHVRFVFTITAFDKSFVVEDILIPAGDYSAYPLNFASIAENIQYAFGITPEEFNTAIDTETGGTLKLYMIDHDTKLFMWDGKSTANNGGYWVDSSNQICTWGATGFAYFIEPWTGEDMSFAIGRAPGQEAGSKLNIKFGVSNADKSKTMTFYLTATME